MSWAAVGETVAKVAPILGGVLGGPVGIVASAAGALVSSVLGTDATPEAVQAQLSANPEALVKLREVEAQQQARLLDWQQAQMNAELANTQDARRREVDLAKAGHNAAWVTSAVAIAVTIGFFAMLCLIVEMDREPNQAALILLGSLGTAFGVVVNYYLGSSLGSTRKTDFLAMSPAIGSAQAKPWINPDTGKEWR